MSKYIVDSSLMTGIADNIRLKTGEEGNLVFPTGFNAAIESLPSIEDMRNIKNKVDDIKDIFDSNESEIDKTITTPVDIASFSDGADDIPMALKVAIEPMQDLHGYENPWPSGGGKNKFNVDELVNTDYITISNGNIIVKGVSKNSGKKLKDCADLTVGETYILTATTTGSNNFFYLYGTNESWYFSNQRTITQQDLDSTIFFYGVQDASVSVTISNMMIRLSSVSDATFAPYSNICPISGWTGANVTRTSVNLSPESEVKIGGSNPRTYSYFIGSNLPAGTYTMSFTKTGTAPSIDNTGTIQIVYTDGDYQTVGRTSPSTFTADKDIRRIYFYMSTSDYNNGYEITFSNIQLESGSTASAYEAYQGNTYSITFPSSAGTVYGGELTVNKDGTGQLVVDRASVDLGTLAWTKEGNHFYSEVISSAKPLTSNTVPSNIMSSNYKNIGAYYVTQEKTNCTIGLNNSRRLYVYDSAYTDAATFKTAMSGVQLVYELETPVTYQLTALEVIKTLKGINNIWSDTGKINEVEYFADSQLYITNKLNELDSLLSTYTETQE